MLSLSVRAAKTDVITVNEIEAAVTFSTNNTYEWTYANGKLSSTNPGGRWTHSKTSITITTNAPCDFSIYYYLSGGEDDELLMKMDNGGEYHSEDDSGIFTRELSAGTHTLELDYEAYNGKAYVCDMKFEAKSSGTIGNNITWNLSDDGTLTLSGAGEMSTVFYREGEGYVTEYPGWNKNKIKKIVIGEGITTTCDVFKDCAVESVSLPSSLKTIYRSSFKNCCNLKSIELPSSLTGINEYAFEKSGLESVTVPSSVQNIQYGIFYNCKNLKSVNWQTSTNFYDYAFYGCENLESIETKYKMSKIASYAFTDCFSLKSIDLSSVQSISGRAFLNCKSLENVAFSPNLTYIGDYAFSGCSSLGDLSIPAKVTSISTTAFKNCNGLKSIVIDPNNTTYDSRDNCNAIIRTDDNWLLVACNSTIIPQTVKSIGSNVFEGMTDLGSIEIPSSVSNYGYEVFSGCTNLTSIICLRTTPAGMGSWTSNGVTLTTWTGFDTSNCTLYVPASSVNAYKNSSSWNVFKSIEAIDTSVKSLSLPTEISMELGSLQSLPYSFSPYYAKNVAVRWTSSNNNIVTVDDGRLSATGVGTADITIINIDNPTIKAVCSVTVTDRVNSMNAGSIKSSAGKTAMMPIYMSNDVTIANTQCDLYLPEGMSVKFDEDEEAYLINKGERLKTAHSISCKKQGDGAFRIMVTSLSNATIKDTDKSLPVMYVPVEIGADVALGSYDVLLKNIIITHYDSETGVTTPYTTDEMHSMIILPQYYKVVVGCNDESFGSVNVESDTYDGNENIAEAGDELKLTATSNTDYRFAYWTVNGTKQTTNPLTITTNADNNIQAVFEENTYTVTFKVDGITYSNTKQFAGHMLQTPTENPTKTGYTFQGWEGVTAETVVPANNVTYNAQFSINQYLVTFVADGVEVYNQKQDYGSSIVAPEAPIKDRYVFISWGEVVSTVPTSAVTYTAEYALLGDTHEDNKINVADLTKLVGIILNPDEELTDRQIKIADVYKDNKINVADYTTLIDFVLNSTYTNVKEQMSERANVKRRAAEVAEYKISSDEIRVEAGTESVDMNLYMSNAETISALQFDITFPEGIDVFYGENEDEDMVYFINKGERAKTDHTASYKKLGDHSYRIMVSSPTNASFKETELNRTKPVVTIRLVLTNGIKDGNYTAKISNIVFSHYDNVNITSVPYYPADAEAKIIVGNPEEEIPVVTEIALVDGEDYSNNETKIVDALTFTKTFSASAVGNWNAFYVPMSIDVEEYAGELDFAEIYAFCATVDTNGNGTVDANDENFLFVRPVKTGCIEANVPYLIRPHEAKTYTINSADNILHKAENGYVEFSTTLDKFTVTGLNEAYTVVAGDNNYYVSASGKLNYRTTGSTTVKANRWIMHRESKKYGSNSSASSEAKEYRIVALGEDMDEADAIEMIKMGENVLTGNENVYTIDGKMVNAASNIQKGIYIRNGKKYIIK